MGKTLDEDPQTATAFARDLIARAVAQKHEASSCAAALGPLTEVVSDAWSGWSFTADANDHGGGVMHFHVSAKLFPAGRSSTFDDWETLGELMGEISDATGYPDECGMPEPIIPMDDVHPDCAIHWMWHSDGSDVDPSMLEIVKRALEEVQAATIAGLQPIVAEPKIGRNDLCSCGSGRKYKKCHGGN